MPQKFVRVRLENGTEKSVPEVVAKTSDYKVLDKPTHGRDGRLLPPKHRTPLGGAASASKAPAKAPRAAADESQED
jgi:hypothetical protein